MFWLHSLHCNWYIDIWRILASGLPLQYLFLLTLTYHQPWPGHLGGFFNSWGSHAMENRYWINIAIKYISNWHNGSSNLTEDGLTLEVHAALHYSSRLLTELTATYSVNGIFIFYYTFNYSELSVCLQMGSSTSGGLWECIEVSLSVVGRMITDHDAVYCSEFHPFISKWGLWVNMEVVCWVWWGVAIYLCQSADLACLPAPESAVLWWAVGSLQWLGWPLNG